MKKLNLEDIINIAKSEKIVPKSQQELKQEKKYKKLEDVEQFILKFKIKSGQHTVTKKMLYKAYTMWSERPTSYVNFITGIRRVFDEYKTNSETIQLNFPTIKILNIVDNYINNIKKI